ncbi:PASTA domain-containing protein [Streptomyces sp. NPDC004726]
MSWGQQQPSSPSSQTPQWGQPSGPPPPEKGPGWARKRIAIPAAVLLFFTGVVIGAAGGGGTESAGDSEAASAATGVKAAPGPTVTATVTVTPAAEKPEKPEKPENAEKSEKPEKAAKAAGKAVPNFIGMGLQAAQDSAQSAGFYLLTSHDSLGTGRNQVWDRNWKVCSQDPKAGSTALPDTEVNFGTVKLEETCP